MRRILALSATVVAVSLLLTGCSIPTLPAKLLSALQPTARFYQQKVVWEDCDNGMSCAMIHAPLDWKHPAAGSIELAMVKHPATGTKKGSLLVDPGGPGGSGGDLVYYGLDDAVDPTLQKNFDVIGFDPRGVGQSTPVTCLSDAKLDDFLYGITPGEVGSDAWVAAKTTQAKAFARSCEKQSGALLAHLDATSVARDMDLERALLGEEKLDYLGYSYGSFLGTLYAGLYPKRVGHLVLDGALDPWNLSHPGDSDYVDAPVNTEQEEAFEHELKAFLGACLRGEERAIGAAGCSFTGTLSTALTDVSTLLQDADEHPLTAADGRLLGSSTLASAIMADLYDSSQWQDLNDLFTRVKHGDASTAFASSDNYNSRADDGSYYDNSAVSNLAIGCLEYGSDDDPTAMKDVANALEQAAPVLGKYDAYGDILCGQWPYGPADFPPPVRARGAAPILVIGTTGDPATPYGDAVALAKQLDSGVLLTLNGDGHTAYNKGNTCIDDAVDRYLLTGKTPKSGTSCS